MVEACLKSIKCGSGYKAHRLPSNLEVFKPGNEAMVNGLILFIRVKESLMKLSGLAVLVATRQSKWSLICFCSYFLSPLMITGFTAYGSSPPPKLLVNIKTLV